MFAVYDTLCRSIGMGNDDYQKAVYGGMTEAEQQALSTKIADNMVEIRITTNNRRSQRQYACRWWCN